jgi:hypothetical protein
MYCLHNILRRFVAYFSTYNMPRREILFLSFLSFKDFGYYVAIKDIDVCRWSKRRLNRFVKEWLVFWTAKWRERAQIVAGAAPGPGRGYVYMPAPPAAILLDRDLVYRAAALLVERGEVVAIEHFAQYVALISVVYGVPVERAVELLLSLPRPLVVYV